MKKINRYYTSLFFNKIPIGLIFFEKYEINKQEDGSLDLRFYDINDNIIADYYNVNCLFDGDSDKLKKVIIGGLK